MNHTDHVGLLRDGVPGRGGAWADLGSGWGAFTLALADLLGAGAVIYSVDRDAQALDEQTRLVAGRFPDVILRPVVGDFTAPLALPRLDGIVMANSLHFIPPEKRPAVFRLVRGYLRREGRLIVVEYDSDDGNVWVPHPLSFATWQEQAPRAGFTQTRWLSSVPSRFMGAIYAAVSW